MSSEAANKAWVTRRLNEQHRLEQEQERAKKLTQRALKAWDTRRKRGWVHPASR